MEWEHLTVWMSWGSPICPELASLLEYNWEKSSFVKFGYPGLNPTSTPFILSGLSPVSHLCIARLYVSYFVLFSNFCPWLSLSLIWHACTLLALLLLLFCKCNTLYWHQYKFWFNKKMVMCMDSSVYKFIILTLQGMLSYLEALLWSRPKADPNIVSITWNNQVTSGSVMDCPCHTRANCL